MAYRRRIGSRIGEYAATFRRLPNGWKAQPMIYTMNTKKGLNGCFA
jgi:hypothetical protein